MTDFGNHPASAGSIIGYLKINKDDWDAKLVEAKAQADELSQGDTKIHISTNMTEVLAELAVIERAKEAAGGNAHISVTADNMPSLGGSHVETVSVVDTGTGAAAAAQRELADAMAASEAASAKADAAYGDLARAQNDASVSAQGVSRAFDDAAAAAKDASAADQRLAEAKKGATAAAAAERDTMYGLTVAREGATAAENDGAKATTNGGNAARGAYGMWAVLGTTLAVLGPAIIPIGAGLATMGAGFLGVGVAGAMAFAGINEQVAAGTTVGNQYDVALKLLHTDLSQLETVAAGAVLAPFLAGAAEFQTAMPAMTSEMQGFANVAGNTVVNVVTGLVNGFQVMAPALALAAQGVQSLSAGFAGFSSGTGLEAFGNYALQELPVVGQLFGSLINTVAQVFIALAPLGSTTLTILTGIATGVSVVTTAINTLPLPVVTGLAGAATGAFIAFKLWGFIGPMVSTASAAIAGLGARIGTTSAAALAGAGAQEAFAAGSVAAGEAATAAGGAIDAALGPIGWVVAGLGALALAWAAVAMNSGPSTQAVQSYTDALKQDNDAIGANVTAQAAKALADSGALQQAKELGVSNQELKNVVLGMPGAMDALNQTLATNKRAAMDAAAATQNQYSNLDTLAAGYTPAVAAGAAWDQKQNALTNTLKTNAGALASAQAKLQAYNAFVAAGAGPTEAMTAATKAMATQLAADGIAADGTVTDLNKLITAMQASGLLAISATQAAVGWYGALDALDKSIQTNGRSLDITTAAGRANETALLGVASAADTLIAADAKNGDSQAQLQNTMDGTYNALIRSEGQFGITGAAADTMARKLMGVPQNIPITAAINGYVQTLLQAAGITNAVNSIPKFIGINVVTTYSSNGTPSNVSQGRGGSGGLTMAGGGLVRHMADGGFTGLLSGVGTGTSDSVPIMGSAGEFMVRSAARQKYGLPMMEAINNGTYQPTVQTVQAGPMHMTGTLVLDSGELMGTFTGVATQVADNRISANQRSAANMRGGRA